jgi:hypothetical protein
MPDIADYGKVNVNLARLKNDNAEGHTQAGLKRSIYKRARETGQDISQVRGRRRPTEVFRDGVWVKV